jgi:hypothetical protein
MPQQILDAYTYLPISRQQKMALRRKAAGLCKHCKEKHLPGLIMCEYHHLLHREYSRESMARLRAERAMQKQAPAAPAPTPLPAPAPTQPSAPTISTIPTADVI